MTCIFAIFHLLHKLCTNWLSNLLIFECYFLIKCTLDATIQSKMRKKRRIFILMGEGHFGVTTCNSKSSTHQSQLCFTESFSIKHKMLISEVSEKYESQRSIQVTKYHTK